jgi:hypothetical protein
MRVASDRDLEFLPFEKAPVPTGWSAPDRKAEEVDTIEYFA